MQPMFTVHAGEYLVGSHIEGKFKKYSVWVPSKDTGIDLLVTDAKNSKTVSLQCKYSKDYVATHMNPAFQNKFKAWGWWTLNRDKIRKSAADLWVFVIQSFHHKTIEYIVIPPDVLLQKLQQIHGKKKLFQTYLWVANNGKCWETRGVKKADKILMANNSYRDSDRDFTDYLNDWTPLKKKLR